MIATAATINGILPTLEATARLGAALALAARPGDCLALDGELGAGKTTLSRAVAEGFGMQNSEEFASPTYTYVNPYAARHAEILHFDFYRVGDAENAYGLGLVEMLARTDALLLIEWAKLLPQLVPRGALWLSLHRTPGDDLRTFRATGGSSALRAALLCLGHTQP